LEVAGEVVKHCIKRNDSVSTSLLQLELRYSGNSTKQKQQQGQRQGQQQGQQQGQLQKRPER